MQKTQLHYFKNFWCTPNLNSLCDARKGQGRIGKSSKRGVRWLKGWSGISGWSGVEKSSKPNSLSPSVPHPER